MKTEKQTLRQELKSVRMSMPKSDVEANSLLITGELIGNVDWAGIKNMHIYSTEAKWNEVETEPVTEYVRKHWPQIEITRPDSSATQAPPQQQFDLVIVPCLGFDEQLYRLGLGTGYYDRFLADQPKALKIGLGFIIGLVITGLPHDSHDVPLDRIITEQAVFERE